MMKPEDFASQFFDLWQQSTSRMMNDPAFSQKMLEMMQQYGQLWQKHGQNENDETPSVRPAADAGHDPVSVDELADRIERCEQRLALLGSLIERMLAADAKPAAGARKRKLEEA